MAFDATFAIGDKPKAADPLELDTEDSLGKDGSKPLLSYKYQAVGIDRQDQPHAGALPDLRGNHRAHAFADLQRVAPHNPPDLGIIYLCGGILLLAFAILVVRYASSAFPSVKVESPRRKGEASLETEKGEL